MLFNYQITANGHPDHFYASGFPFGLRIDIPSGLISGTFAQSGTYTMAISAINTGGSSAATVQMIVTDLPPVVTSTLVAFGESGRPFNYQITAAQKISSYTVTGLPAGLSFNAATGLISGTPSVNGDFQVPISVSNSGGNQSVILNLDFYSLQPVITSPLLVSSTVGGELSYQIQATGNPSSYAATGLPFGLSVDHGSGLISGTLAPFATTRVLNWGSSADYGSVPSDLNDVVAVASTYKYNLALRRNGTVVGWGIDYGVGVAIPADLNNVIAVAVTSGFYFFAIALKGDGTLVTWGGDFYNLSQIPIGLGKVTSIGLDSTHCLAVKQDGTVAAWGDNSYGQCNVPADLNGVVAVAGGWAQSLALKSDGTVVAWGSSNTVPTGLNGVVAIAVGACNLALKNDGTITAWGGDTSAIPPNLKGIVAISPSLALKSDGTVVSLTGSSGMPTGLSGVVGIGDGIAITNQISVPLSASNPYGSGTATLVIQGPGSAPQIAPVPDVSGTCGELFNLQIVATHSPVNYSASGLPAGLNLDPVTGAISGFPSVSGSFVATLQAVNASGTGTALVNLNFQPAAQLPPVILSATGTITTTGTLFRYQIVASHFPVNYSVTGLPAGLSLDPATGIISGTCTDFNTSTVTIGAANLYGTGSAQLNIIAPPFFTCPLDLYCTIGLPFSFSITVDNYPALFNVSGLPSWVSGYTSITGDSTSCNLQGTPTMVGTTEVPVTVFTTGSSNAGAVFIGTSLTGASSNSATFRIHAIAPDAPMITSPLVVTCSNQYSFSYQLTTSSSATGLSVSGIPSWATTTPPSLGYILANMPWSGMIYGTPTETGTTLVTVSTWNVSGSDQRTLALVVEQAPPTLTSPLNASGNSGSLFSYQITGNRSPTGFVATGIPSWATFDPATGIISGTPTSPGKYLLNIGASNSAGVGVASETIHIYANPVLEKIYQFPGQNLGCSTPVLGGDGALYGTTSTGGANSLGSVFRVSASGVMTELYSFNGTDGSSPTGLVQGKDGAFYGVTSSGGTDGYGTVFKITTNGAFSSLYSFLNNGSPGVVPVGTLALGGDGAFYGVTSYAGWQLAYYYYPGSWTGVGSEFKITTTGSLTVIGSLPSTPPAAGLLSGTDGAFYGTLSSGNGSVCKITLDGSCNTIFNFNGGNKVGGVTSGIILSGYNPPAPVLPSGVNPGTSLVQGDDGELYGATNYLFVNPNNWGGGSGAVLIISWQPTYFFPGTVFKLTTDGTLQSSFNFPQGVTPNGMALASDGGIYGTTDYGGVNGQGSLFRVDANGQASDLFSFDGDSFGGTPKTALSTGGDGNLYGVTNNTLFRLRFIGPLVTTLPYTGLTNTTVILNGTVDTNGSNITVNFEYGTSPTLAGATTTSGTAIGVNAGIVPVSVPVNGLVMGTTYYYRAKVVSSGGTYFGNILSFIAGQPVITSSLSITGTQSTDLNYQIVATNSPSSYAASNLPSGLVLDSSTGLISGSLCYASQVSSSISAINSSGTVTATLSFTILQPPPVITSSLSASSYIGYLYFFYPISASNNPTRYNAIGLPPGLSVNTVYGLVTGTPTVTGTFTSTIEAISATGTGSASLVITVNPPSPVITSPLIVTYPWPGSLNYQIAANNNPTSFNAIYLPSGAYVNTQQGRIYGTLNSSGTFSCSVGAWNAAGGDWQTLIIVVQPQGASLQPTLSIPYSVWIGNYASNTGFISAASAVNNTAGIPNALAYTLGVNPISAGVSDLPRAGIESLLGSRYLSLSFSWNLGASGNSWTVEATNNLNQSGGWSPIATGSGGAVSGFVSLSGSSNIQDVLVRDPLPMVSGSGRFLRLKVTQP